MSEATTVSFEPHHTSLQTRDGIRLAVSRWQADDLPRPAVLVRTPYGRRRFGVAPWTRLIEAGYGLVTVDVRGRGDSEGVWRPWVKDDFDGYDVIEWVAAQTWCDGNVATIGGSYDAITQWWAAEQHPPHLRCMIPISVSPQHETSPPYGRSNGVVMPYWLWWLKYLGVLTPDDTAIDWQAVMAAAPQDMAEAAGVEGQAWSDYLNGAIGYGEASWAVDPRRIRTPALITNGLWDDPKTFSWWLQLAQSPAAAHHQLLIGAWDHAGNAAPRPVLGGIDLSAVALDPVAHWLAFLDRWMRPARAAKQVPPVTICRSGVWQWETHGHWPLGSHRSPLDLGGGSWRHDPDHPLWLGGSSTDLAFADPPLDRTHLDARPDVLSLDLPPAESPIRISGEPVIELAVTQESPGTVVGWLSDIAPDGTGLVLGLWPHCARHPGGTATLRLQLAPVHHELAPGHRFRVSLASSYAPIYAHARQAQQVSAHSVALSLPLETSQSETAIPG